MSLFRNAVLSIFALSLWGCAVDGKHLYVEGKCVSCWQDTFKKDKSDYEIIGANNYDIISWQELALEGLSREDNLNVATYGEDYLTYKLGSNSDHSLTIHGYTKRNELTYRRDVKKATEQLESDLHKHQLKPIYQITMPSTLDNYDFDRQEFPVDYTTGVTLEGGKDIKLLPKEISVIFDNYQDFPELKMPPHTAENFLKGRNQKRKLFIRYIFEINAMTTQSSFQGTVKEIQFIDVVPKKYYQTRKEIEKYAPFEAIQL